VRTYVLTNDGMKLLEVWKDQTVATMIRCPAAK
jgi:hypothetical protein